MTSSRTVLDRLQDVLRRRQHEIPAGQGFEGTGAPGLYLEHLLGLRTSNADIPDAGEWEIKFSSGSSLVTLFHKDPYPRGVAVRYMINRWRVFTDGEWFFSVTDVIEAITESPNPRRYWSDLKRKLTSEGASQLYETIVQLKMPGAVAGS